MVQKRYSRMIHAIMEYNVYSAHMGLKSCYKKIK